MFILKNKCHSARLAVRQERERRVCKLILLLLTVIGFSSCSDDKLDTELWFEQATKAAVVAHEKVQGGTLHESELTKDAEVYMRDATAALPLKVRYYFSKADKVEKVMYEWSKIIPQLDSRTIRQHYGGGDQ